MAILPSELCRLVLGFLEEQNLPETCKTFLGECRYLEECRIFSDRGVPFIKTVHGKKLVDYVNRNYINELKSVETQTDSEPPLIASNSPSNNQQSHVNKRKNTQVKKRTSQIVLNSSHVVVEASESPKHAGNNVNSSLCNHGNSDNIGTVDTNTTTNAHLLLDEIDIDPKHLITDLFIENLCQQGFPDKLAQLINARAKTTTSTTTLSPSVVRTSLSNQHNLNSSMNMNITTTHVDENPSTTAISSEATTSTQAANSNTNNNNFSTDYSNSTNEAASSSKPSEETTTTTTTANQSISGAHFQEEIVIVSSSSSSNQNIDHDRQQKTNECTFDSMYNALTEQDLVLQDQDANIKWPDFLTNNEGISGIADLFCEEATLTLHNIFTSNVQEDGEDEGEEVADSPESEAYYNLNDQMNTPKKIGSNKRPYLEETESQKKRPRSLENDSNGDSNNPNTTRVIPVEVGIEEQISSKKPRNHETNEEKERQVAKIGEPIFSTNKERTSAIIISKCARDKELALRKLGKSTNELREETQTEIRPIELAPNEISTSTQIDISMSSEIMSQTQNDISINGQKKRRNKPNRKPTIQQIFENSLKSPSPNSVDTPPVVTSQIDLSLSQETTTTTTTTTTTKTAATNKKKIAPLKKFKKHFNDFSKSIFNDQ